jgi:hypothetical protein
MVNDAGTGWLIEDAPSFTAFGLHNDEGTWVPFTHPGVIRFSREQDAEAMQSILGYDRDDVRDATVSEHRWMDMGIDTDDGKSPSLEPAFLSALQRGLDKHNNKTEE